MKLKRGKGIFLRKLTRRVYKEYSFANFTSEIFRFQIPFEFVVVVVDRPETTKEEVVEALELLGASFANDNDHYDIGN